MRRHSGPAFAFAALALVWTYPLVTHLSGQIPGYGAGDNIQFLWNFWWMRVALASGLDVFHTSYLFAPVGTDLTLHTSTVLPAYVGATAAGFLSPITTLNLWIVGSLFLNGLCAYLLAFRITGNRAAAVIGGLAFACSPYIAARLAGHFNLIAAWTIPLFVLAALNAMDGRKPWAALAGLVIAATAYIDYYYVVFQVLLAVVMAALARRSWSIRFAGRGSRARVWASRVVGALITVDLLVIGAIATLGGFTVPVGRYEISAQSLYNPLQIFWLLTALWCWLRFSPKISSSVREGSVRVLPSLAVIATVFLVGALPIIIRAADLIREGDYVTQKYFWRSAPAGVDLGTVVMGHPFHGVWGEGVRSLYDRLGIGAMESSGWLGVVPVVLALIALREYRANASTRYWMAIGSVFLLWALGPHLRIFGAETGMILPAAFVRYLPFVNNARMPARAMVVVSLAIAMLAAIAIHRRQAGFSGRPLALGLVAAALVLEMMPAPFPMVAVSPPRLYEILRLRPEPGAVCELPMGLHDGFGGRGLMNDATMFYQTVHGRPMTGGYIARLSPSLVRAYASDPLLDALLKLSESDGSANGEPLPVPAVAAERLRSNGIAFVVLDRQTASDALIQYVETVLPLELITTEGPRSLYLVK